ncbi:hypothetical protein BKD30_13815 [Tersicoccus phoenicis]|uniref:Integral membrane protein n=1 Tax=Tersicoccus phoenicis TaxID=554083 RepID=A0A1R1L6P4_9MICC|nr:DUF6350 family protein [Tersicoccus phoenicis]OMH23210.1 hypothetical protein BKD30_13815 [Tersicoccus phoenicis]
MKMTLGPRGHRHLPMPLWLQGAVVFLQAALISAVLVLVPVFAAWGAGGFADRSAVSAARLAGQVWLLLHGAPLTVSSGGGTGLFSLIPLGGTLVPLLLAWRGGRRLARASYTDQLWQAVLGALGVYALAGAATAYICSTPEVSVPTPVGALVPLVPVAVGLIAGARREAGSWCRLVGVDTAARIARSSQRSRWAGSYLRSVLRAGCLAVLATLAAGAVLLTVTLAVRWADVITITEALHPGVVGSTALTIGQLSVLPNLAVWAASYASGAGFQLGTGTTVNPFTTDLGALPTVPVLGAVPTSTSALALLTLLIPVVAGMLAGWWFLREAENHLDDWLALRIRVRWVSAPLSTLALAGAVGVVAGLLMGLAARLSGGGIGLGRLTDLGPPVGSTAVLIAAEVAVGVVIGYVVGPWLERQPPLEEVPARDPVSATVEVEDLQPSS